MPEINLLPGFVNRYFFLVPKGVSPANKLPDGNFSQAAPRRTRLCSTKLAQGCGLLFPTQAKQFACSFDSKLDSFGAEGGNRTPMSLRPADFESAASACSATSAQMIKLPF
jgi:hypothetical protein